MPVSDASTFEKIQSLRQEFNSLGIDGFIIPRSDEYLGEYVAPYAERLAFVTGFTGSAGHAVILKDKAVTMSDGRYTIQLDAQVDADCFETADSMKVSIGDWLNENADDNAIIGYDPRLHTAKEIARIESEVAEKKITLKALSYNPVDKIWEDQPEPPMGIVSLFPDDIAGLSAAEKKERIVETIREKDAQGCVITAPESICWLLNVRGSDMAFIPVALSTMLVDVESDKLDWFIDYEKVPDEVHAHLQDIVNIYAPQMMEGRLKELAGRASAQKRSILMDYQRGPVYFKNKLEEFGADIEDSKDPCIDPRAQKTKAEQESIRKAHIEDGVAMVKFLHWLDQNAASHTLDEIGVAEQLESFRREGGNYLEASFATISGFEGNGAIVHYHATEKTNAKIDRDGLLLVDSGGQYQWGTTDITRTIAIGEPSLEMRENFTGVLKAHIALARQKFPKGTTGAQIDAITRATLWNAGLDFAHGTGHGVGCYLSVHEEAASISSRGRRAELKPGMLLSNEPGYYQAGAYGIRIENLVLVQETDQKLHHTDGLVYAFETVSFAPIDRHLIDATMLEVDELEWLNAYHMDVFETLSPHLDEERKNWLAQATRAIEPS